MKKKELLDKIERLEDCIGSLCKHLRIDILDILKPYWMQPNEVRNKTIKRIRA